MYPTLLRKYILLKGSFLDITMLFLCCLTGKEDGFFPITIAASCFLKSSLMFRSSHPEVFCSKGVLKHFAKFTGKHLCQSVVFNKVAGIA